MSDSLRDQLLGLGFKPAPAPARKPEQRPANTPVSAHHPNPAAKPRHRKPAEKLRREQGRPQPASPRTREEIDLAKAYAIRAQKEKDELIEAERLKQEDARERREAKAKLAELLKDQALNDPAAEIARHFDYGGKIKRIHVTVEQLKALNAGELGVVQLDGRYLLIPASLLAQAEALFAPAIALKIDPSASAADDPYADPQYQVPDDLVW
ncbi:MAG TPA: DUF2058 family protein [Luteimonas sp.]|nr:DUF2058 family protein [Luteimonas sp.]